MPLAPVGPLVGPLSGRSVSSTLLVDGAGAYDFAIGGLGFKSAISDERPYERVTAQFRKEQFDSQAQVGDQSLTGWWTRGQLSFHKGAGVTFYEVLDGDAVGNRFFDSADVDVSDPGHVTLAHDWTAGASVASIVTAAEARGSVVFYTVGGGIRNDSGDSYTTTDASAGSAVTADQNGNVFVATTGQNIELTDTGLGAGSVLYTHTEDLLWLWYAKNRLWLIDAVGDLYQLGPNPSGPPVAIAGGDKVCSLNEDAATNWYLAESPGAVYLASGQSGIVYGITLDSDGSVPTVTAPVEVARLPRGESLVAMGYYLGQLILQTSTSVRLAAVDANGVTLGPEIVDLAAVDHSYYHVTGIGSKVYVAGDDSVVSIDLGQAVEDTAAFAWVHEHLESDIRGVAAVGNRPLFYTSTEVWLREAATLSPTGYLQTGQHRLGTLEPKKFVSVRVMAEGASGSIVVSRVDADGTETSLHTLNLESANQADITLGMSGTAVSVGLRFDLFRDDATHGPTLLGYQIKALPAPKRQRMIRIPLMLFDSERRQPARADGKQAYARLAALEAMEESGGTFTFQDFRTGETGECYVEQIEHQGKTPPSAHNNGYGGIVFITLRKV